jgi:hypothetical protein
MTALVGRQIAITLQYRTDDPSVRRLVAECADSITVIGVETSVVDPIYELGRDLVSAHQELCAACRGHVLPETVQ